jgi:hypothetical protein
MKSACGMARAQGKRGRLCYGLRHDRLVAGKCEGCFFVKKRVSPHFGSKHTQTVSQARKEAAPQQEGIATAISKHEAAKHLKAAKTYTLSNHL